MGIALDTKQLTISNSATIADFGFSAAELTMAESAVISVRSDNALLCYDGNTPVSGLAHQLTKDNIFTLKGRQNIHNIKLAKQTNNTIVTITLEYND